MQWLSPNKAAFYYGGANAVSFYNEKVTNRRQQIKFEKNDKFAKHIQEINDSGFTKWNQAIDHDIIDTINDKVSYLIENNKNLKLNDEHYAMVADPFLNVPECIDLAFSDHMIDFAASYFDCYPAIGTFNLRRSFVNNYPPKTTQLYHCDRNSIKFFKFFIYLNDVQAPEDGPLTIVKGSNTKRPPNAFTKHRWSDDEIISLYGQENITYLTAKKGDLIAATTTCFHKGTKPSSKNRTMLTLNYVIHPELAGGQPGRYEKLFKIPTEKYDTLKEQKKRAADFLEKV